MLLWLGCLQKIFCDHFSKSLVTIQVFTSGTWAPTGFKNGGNQFSLHFGGRTMAIKAWNVGREGQQLCQKIMNQDYLWTVTAEIICDHFEIRDTTVMTFLWTFFSVT